MPEQGAATPQQPGPHTCLPLKALGGPGTLAWPPASSGSSLTGSPRHLTQAALPRELTHRMPQLRPKLHPRGLHAGHSAPPTAQCSGSKDGAQCTWPFPEGCCPPLVSSQDKGLGPTHQAAVGKP